MDDTPLAPSQMVTRTLHLPATYTTLDAIALVAGFAVLGVLIACVVLWWQQPGRHR